MAGAAGAAVGYEDLVELAKMAMGDLKRDAKAAELAQLYRDYLRGVSARDREAPVLAAARHALLCSRVSGRPSLGAYACKAAMGSMMPRLLELCHADWPEYAAVLTPYHDNGLFANVLQVCDALLLSAPGAPVLVEWRRQGEEGHFQYGPPDFDLFAHLFEESDRCRSVASCPGAAPPEGTVTMKTRINPVFMNMLRGYTWTLPPEDLAAMRRTYFQAATSVLRPSPRVAAAVDEVCSAWGQGAYVIGVHKRLGTPEVAACQLSQRAPSSEEFIARVRALARKAPAGSRHVVFLATDDAHAASAFRQAFPDGHPPRNGDAGGVDLCYRHNVKRSEGGVRADGVDNEVHRSPCEAGDAEDALVDALCLSRCQDLVCTDSNLSLFVAAANPDIEIHALNSILPDGWEQAAERPAQDVHETYKVVYSPMVFVRRGPSAATELHGAKKCGEVVTTTGRCFDGWVEIDQGGWMLLDAEQQVHGRGQGMLLEPTGPARRGPPLPAAPLPELP